MQSPPGNYPPPDQRGGYQPPFVMADYDAPFVPAARPAKEPSTGLLLELLGLVGFAGIGWLWAGRTARGLLLMFGFWMFLLIEFLLLFLIVGFFLIPFNFVIPVVSALLIQKHLKDRQALPAAGPYPF